MGKPVEKKRKKKGRPSLLDLHRRSLRLQKQQQQQQPPPQTTPAPNPYLRFPAAAPGRRNPSPGLDGAGEGKRHDDDEEDEEEEEGAAATGKRRERKLKLVLRLHEDGARPGSAETNRAEFSGSESNGEGGGSRKRRKVHAVGGGEESGPEKAERHDLASKATDPLQGGPSDSGPTRTPLPDEKLLVFVLDMLQKKDTYGVFSEPADPNELPDYHEVIKHPMDFGTVRKRLLSGYYANLEMFEEDVFLICSNAMRYNAPDTIYFRQARSIQELAKKNFENLRQESSDDDEPEPKIVRRGRPPSKNTIKRAVGRPHTERASSDFSSGATLANAGENTLWSNSSHDLTRKGFSFDKPRSVDPRVNYGLRNSENCNWMTEKSDRYSESGSVKGILIRSGKKVFVLDENRRNTYKQCQSSTCWRESSVLTVFDGEKRQLVPIGFHIGHAYARSLARFAANLGPVGWEIAAERIEKVLPPGTKFGCGWVGEPDVTQQRQPPVPSGSPPHPLPHAANLSSKADTITERRESPSPGAAVEGGCVTQTTAFAASSNIAGRSSNSTEGAQPVRQLNSESSFGMARGNSSSGIEDMRPKAPFQHQKMATVVHPGINGLSNTTFGFDLSQVGKIVRPARLTGDIISEAPTTHARALDMVSRGDVNFFLPSNPAHIDTERPKISNSVTVNSVSSLLDSSQDLHGGGPWREFSLRPKTDSTLPPDLNIRFQSTGSSPSIVVVDSQQQPDLALQL